MMKGQARLSVGIIGFDTYMILEPCMLRIPGQRTGHKVINQPSRHYAEALHRAEGHQRRDHVHGSRSAAVQTGEQGPDHLADAATLPEIGTATRTSHNGLFGAASTASRHIWPGVPNGGSVRVLPDLPRRSESRRRSTNLETDLPPVRA
jgi:hypothetical protein